jgi:hypothetical protein
MLSALLAADDGIWAGKLNLADVFFLIAAIVFGIAFIIRLMIKPIPLDSVLIAAGLMLVALGFLVL